MTTAATQRTAKKTVMAVKRFVYALCSAHVVMFINRNLFYLNQIGTLQTVNGDASQEDYTAKTHELQTIIEKQVR